jgi:hypothetical protein
MSIIVGMFVWAAVAITAGEKIRQAGVHDPK